LLYGGCILVVLEVCYRFATGGLARPPGGSPGAWAKKANGATLRSALAAAAVVVIGVAGAFAYCGVPGTGGEPFKKVAAGIPAGARQPVHAHRARSAGGSARIPSPCRHPACAAGDRDRLRRTGDGSGARVPTVRAVAGSARGGGAGGDLGVGVAVRAGLPEPA